MLAYGSIASRMATPRALLSAPRAAPSPLPRTPSRSAAHLHSSSASSELFNPNSAHAARHDGLSRSRHSRKRGEWVGSIRCRNSCTTTYARRQRGIFAKMLAEAAGLVPKDELSVDSASHCDPTPEDHSIREERTPAISPGSEPSHPCEQALAGVRSDTLLAENGLTDARTYVRSSKDPPVMPSPRRQPACRMAGAQSPRERSPCRIGPRPPPRAC